MAATTERYVLFFHLSHIGSHGFEILMLVALLRFQRVIFEQQLLKLV